jgi:molybdenum cofactor synthesis domain-containing protein
VQRSVEKPNKGMRASLPHAPPYQGGKFHKQLMPSAEIITIGTELLLGEIHDTNATYIARELRDVGIDLYRKTTIGDNARRIAQTIQEAMQRTDIIITTGGLGPTVDDPTREAVALAVGVEVEFIPELWEQIQNRFQRFGRKPTENKRAWYCPKAPSRLNPVGTAPSFIVEFEGYAIISCLGAEMNPMQNAVLPTRRRYDLHGSSKRGCTLAGRGIADRRFDQRPGNDEQPNGRPAGPCRAGGYPHHRQGGIRSRSGCDDPPLGR